MARIWQQAYGYTRGAGKAVVADRPLVRWSSGVMHLELSAPDAIWVVELSEADCERIAEEIGWRRPSI